MNKEFIPYEQALELKKLGFNEPCLGFYRIFSDGDTELLVNSNSDMRQLESPTFSQAFRWFREKYNCHHTINLNKKYVGIAYSSVVNFSIDEFNTYEEAELACLKKLIEIVKEKK